MTSIYGIFSNPRARLYKVCSHPCMYAPGFIVSIRAKWPRQS